MSVKIRLSRAGAKKNPYYYIVVANARSPRDGNFLEKVGTYNPMVPKDHADRLTLKNERISYWLSVGAQPTDRVALFLGKAGLITPRPQANNAEKAKPKAKAQERAREAAAKAEEAAKQAAEG